MNEQNVAKTYAKALMQLAEERQVDVADELVKFNDVIRENNDLETLMFIDVFTPEEKMSVVGEVIKRMELSDLLLNFIQFLCDENRLNMFPMVFKEVIVADDFKKGFMRGTIEGRDQEIDQAMFEKIKNFINKEIKTEARLDYRQSNRITAGYKVTVGDLQLDASVDNQLNILKNTIINS